MTLVSIRDDRTKPWPTQKDEWQQINNDLNRSQYYINGNLVSNRDSLSSILHKLPAHVTSFIVHTAHQGLFAAHEMSIATGPTAHAAADAAAADGVIFASTPGRTQIIYRIETFDDGSALVQGISTKRISAAIPAELVGRRNGGNIDDSPRLTNSGMETHITIKMSSDGAMSINGLQSLKIHHANPETAALLDLAECLPALTSVERRTELLKEYLRHCNLPEELPPINESKHTYRRSHNEQRHRNLIKTSAEISGLPARDLANRLLDVLIEFKGELVDPMRYISRLCDDLHRIDESELPLLIYLSRRCSPYMEVIDLYYAAADISGESVDGFQPAASIEHASVTVRDAFLSCNLPITGKAMQGWRYRGDPSALPLRLQLLPQARRKECADMLDLVIGLVRELRMVIEDGNPLSLGKQLMERSFLDVGQSRLWTALATSVTLHAKGVRTALPDELANFAISTMASALREEKGDLRRQVLDDLFPQDKESPIIEMLAAPIGPGWDRARTAFLHMIRNSIYIPRSTGGQQEFSLDLRLGHGFVALNRSARPHLGKWHGLARVVPRSSFFGGWVTGGAPILQPLQHLSAEGVFEHLEMLELHAISIRNYICDAPTATGHN